MPLFDPLVLCRGDRRPPYEWEEGAPLRVGEGGPETSEPAKLESSLFSSCLDLSRSSSDLANWDLERLWLFTMVQSVFLYVQSCTESIFGACQIEFDLPFSCV